MKALHELAIHQRRDALEINPFCSQEFARIFHIINASRLNCHGGENMLELFRYSSGRRIFIELLQPIQLCR